LAAILDLRPEEWQATVHESKTRMRYMGGWENLREVVTKGGF
jgi:hypothetical protein